MPDQAGGQSHLENELVGALVQAANGIGAQLGSLLRWLILVSFGAGVFFASITWQIRTISTDVVEVKDALSVAASAESRRVWKELERLQREIDVLDATEREHH